uniref:Uncharacterized protein n=1 Tax=Cacopsylla melanoneura TaxID=428564 RepID=A0A8D8URH1_9HEMI
MYPYLYFLLLFLLVLLLVPFHLIFLSRIPCYMQRPLFPLRFGSVLCRFLVSILVPVYGQLLYYYLHCYSFVYLLFGLYWNLIFFLNSFQLHIQSYKLHHSFPKLYPQNSLHIPFCKDLLSINIFHCLLFHSDNFPFHFFVLVCLYCLRLWIVVQ